MRCVWVMVVLGSALATVRAFPHNDESARIDRIEDDLSVITQYLKQSIGSQQPQPMQQVKLPLANARVVAATNKVQMPPTPSSGFVEAPEDNTLKIVPIPGSASVEFRKLPEPVLNPTDKYEVAEDEDAELLRMVTTGPCETNSLMPEPDEIANGAKKGCGVPGGHQIGRSRIPGVDSVFCPGSPYECSNNGICERGKCRCSPLFYGEDCSLHQCFPACSSNGVCNNGTCECRDGWEGPTCEATSCFPMCASTGLCKSGVCECAPGWFGPTCAAKMCPGKPMCGGPSLGECNNSTGHCECNKNRGGEDCSKIVLACEPQCLNRGVCNNGTCACAPGWQGDDCGTKVPRKYACEGGAVWTEKAPAVTLTCDNLGEEIPKTGDHARCACPPQTPVFDTATRQCVETAFCGSAICGPMAPPNSLEVAFNVLGNTQCSRSPLPGTCSGCVEAHRPIQICYAVGNKIAELFGHSKDVIIALTRQDGSCDGEELSPTFEALMANGTFPAYSQVTNDTSVDEDTKTVTQTQSTVIMLGPTPVFKGIPYVRLQGASRRAAGSVTLRVPCTGVYAVHLLLVDNLEAVTKVGDCQVAAQNAACPGTPACSGHGTCQEGFNRSVCQCNEGFQGSDCSLRYINLPKGRATILPGNITTTIPIPPEATIVQSEDNTTVILEDGAKYAFFKNGTVVEARVDGKVQIVHPPQAYPDSAHNCKPTTIWQECSSGCFPTCRNPHPRCLPTCAQGACQCPASAPVWDERAEQCVGFHACSEQSSCPGVGVPCSGKGECVDGKCSCQVGWTGEDCSEYRDPGPRVTTKSGTVDEPTQCHFPFKFRGRVFNDCTTDFDSEGKEWCSVTNEWEQRWGYCSPRGTCPSKDGVPCNGKGTCVEGKCVCQPLFSGAVCTAEFVRYINTTGERCTLPFIGPDGKESYDCIRGVPVVQDGKLAGNGPADHPGDSWCLKTFRWNSTADYGFCEPVGSCGKCSDIGGTCDSKGSGACICHPGFSGVDCSHRMSEKEILLKLFLDTSGHSWNRQYGWTSGGEPCDTPSWTGVTCKEGHVVRINLDSTLLTGNIPAELSALPRLEVLDLSNNHLSGGFPAALLSSPASLRSVAVSGNYLTGDQPQAPEHYVFSDFSNNYWTNPLTSSQRELLELPERAVLRVTNGQGTVEMFTPCAFPFEYNGRNYTSCTTDGTTDMKPWCSTTPLYSGDWGKCAPVETCTGANETQCSGHGACNKVKETGIAVICECEEGWAGKNCSIPVVRVTVRREDGQSTIVNGKRCHFPFEYRGQVYHDCTAVGSNTNQEWCLTTAVWERKWAYCAPRGTCAGAQTPCSGHGSCNTETALCTCEEGWSGDDCAKKIPRVVTGVKTRRGQLCHFPFVFNGTTYTDCTTDPSHEGQPYCALQGGNLEDHNEWDFCAELGTCPGVQQCSESGVCVDGRCQCDIGFTGTDCSSVMDEHDVLVKLFETTNGKSWASSDGWGSDDHCQWHGIKCNPEGKVVQILLSNNLLDGTMPAELGFFGALEVLDLSHNLLAGTIPRTFEQLNGLSVFDVENNELVGGVPANLRADAISCDENCLDSNICAKAQLCA